MSDRERLIQLREALEGSPDRVTPVAGKVFLKPFRVELANLMESLLDLPPVAAGADDGGVSRLINALWAAADASACNQGMVIPD
jgi:hypothetical protein